MKVCPHCQSRYEESSRYCRKDGAELVPDRAVAPEVLARRELLERRIGQEPEDARLLEELGDLLAGIPLFDEALVQYFKALELEPGRAAVRRKVAEVYRARGDWADAAKHLELLADESPADLDLLGEQADVYVRSGRRADAAEVLARMTDLAPVDASLWRRRRDLSQELRRDEELFEAYRRLTELEPGDLSHWLPLGRRFLADGAEASTDELARLERRLSKAQAAGELGPGQRRSHLVLYLAALRLRLGTAGPGLRDLLRDVDSSGLDAPHTRLASDCLAELGDLAARGGDGEQALDCYGAALKFGDSARARRGVARLHRARAEELAAAHRYGEAVAACDAGLALAGEDAELLAVRRLASGRRTRRVVMVVALCAAALLAVVVVFSLFRGDEPTAEGLKASFVDHLKEVDAVKGLSEARGGGEITFKVGDDRWRVVVDRASVTPINDDTGALRGVLQTHWEKNGSPVSSRRSLPSELVKAGFGPRLNDARYNRYRKRWKWNV